MMTIILRRSSLQIFFLFFLFLLWVLVLVGFLAIQQLDDPPPFFLPGICMLLQFLQSYVNLHAGHGLPLSPTFQWLLAQKKTLAFGSNMNLEKPCSGWWMWQAAAGWWCYQKKRLLGHYHQLLPKHRRR